MLAVIKGPLGYKGNSPDLWTHDWAYLDIFHHASLAQQYIQDYLTGSLSPKYQVIEIDAEGVEQLRARLREIPLDDDYCLIEPFLHFKIGTSIKTVYYWFNTYHLYRPGSWPDGCHSHFIIQTYAEDDPSDAPAN
jgi:hypothetical protein